MRFLASALVKYCFTVIVTCIFLPEPDYGEKNIINIH